MCQSQTVLDLPPPTAPSVNTAVPRTALSSAEYLKLMEQANEQRAAMAAGLAANNSSISVAPPSATAMAQHAQATVQNLVVPPAPNTPLSLPWPTQTPSPIHGMNTVGSGVAPNGMAPMSSSAQPSFSAPGVESHPATTINTPVQPFVPYAPINPQSTASPTISGQPLSSARPWSQPVERPVLESPYAPPANYYAQYDALWLHRDGDKSLSYSTGGTLGSFGSEFAGRYTVGKMLDAIEAIEFRFAGSLHWDRSQQSAGPVNANIQSPLSGPSIDTFQNAAQTQYQSASLNMYELNKRWYTDDLSNMFFGLNVIDYDEHFLLQSSNGSGAGTLGVNTSNLLAGGQMGVQVWRPVSQRWLFGGNGSGGLYSNFSNGNIAANNNSTVVTDASDRRFHLATTGQLTLNVEYRVSSHFTFYGGYQWLYIAGLATVQNQPPNPMVAGQALDLTSNAGVLFHGPSAGVEAKF